jgi:hypothetical protein
MERVNMIEVHYICMHKNTIMRHTKNWKGESGEVGRGIKSVPERMSLIKVRYMHVWSYHN